MMSASAWDLGTLAQNPQKGSNNSCSGGRSSMLFNVVLVVKMNL
jgi:hypothetical protein